MRTRMLAGLVLACVILFTLGTYVIVTAQEGKPYAEGQAPGATLQASTAESSAPRYAEGKDPNAVMQSGPLDAAQREQINSGRLMLMGGGSLPLLYRFSGVVDDGARGVNGKAATSVTCTNTSGTAAQVAVYIYGSDALATYYYVTLTIPAWFTYTFSTQFTNLYYDDTVFETFLGGTNAIRQGMGSVFTDSNSIICNAQVLDPTGLPPAFMTELEMFR